MAEQARQDRIHKLIALCVKNNLTPDKPGWGDRVRWLCLSQFGLAKRAARDLAATVYGAWRGDHWKCMVQQNEYLTEDQKQKWLNEHR
jgi:hypothetical protein